MFEDKQLLWLLGRGNSGSVAGFGVCCLQILLSTLLIFKSIFKFYFKYYYYNEHLTPWSNIHKFTYWKKCIFRGIFSQLVFKLCSLQKHPVTISVNCKLVNITIFLTHYKASVTNQFLYVTANWIFLENSKQ